MAGLYRNQRLGEVNEAQILERFVVGYVRSAERSQDFVTDACHAEREQACVCACICVCACVCAMCVCMCMCAVCVCCAHVLCVCVCVHVCTLSQHELQHVK